MCRNSARYEGAGGSDFLIDWDNMGIKVILGIIQVLS